MWHTSLTHSCRQTACCFVCCRIRSLIEMHWWLVSSGELDDREWRFLLTGGVALSNPFPNPARGWLSDKSWSEIVRSSEIPALKGFMDHFKNNVWSTYLTVISFKFVCCYNETFAKQINILKSDLILLKVRWT